MPSSAPGPGRTQTSAQAFAPPDNNATHPDGATAGQRSQENVVIRASFCFNEIRSAPGPSCLGPSCWRQTW
eukprot:9690814-Alexandrium_andersonii.AAC.1